MKKRCDALMHELGFVLTPTCPRFYTRAEIAAMPAPLGIGKMELAARS